MDRSEAQSHIEMVDRIIEASDNRRLYAGGEFFVVWGLVSTIFMLLIQWVVDGKLAPWCLAVAPLLIVGAVLFSILRSRYYQQTYGRMSLLQREFLNILYIAQGVAFVLNLIGAHLFPQWAQSAIWTVADSIVLFFIALHGNVRALIGGVVMLASIALANFNLAYAGYILAGGFLIGYAGFGAVELIARE